MAIFPIIQLEKICQVDDKTRIDSTRSFVSKDEADITKVEIEPEASAGFVDITGSSADDYYLDYSYASAGDKVITTRVTTDGAPTSVSETLTIISVVDDHLFSNDADLVSHEFDMLKWLPPGRASYLNIHRRSQELVMNWIDKKGYTDTDGNRLTKTSVTDIEEVRQWSTYMTLRLIFESISNKVDDVFSIKAKRYKGLEVDARNKSFLRLDINNDGTTEVGEGVRISTARLSRG